MSQEAKNLQQNKISLLLSSAKMAVATFTSRILGLVREQVIAAYFGASGLTDAFQVAYRVPNMLRDLFAEGAFSSAFVPIFTEAKNLSEKEARGLLWSLFILLGSVTGLITLFIFIFTPEIISFLTSEKFVQDSVRFEASVWMTRVMSPFLVFISLSALFMGALNTLKVFFVPSLAPACFNVAMIGSILIGTPLLMERGLHGIYSLAIGVLLGGFVQMLVQVPLLFKKAFGPAGPIQIWSEHTKKILNRLGIGTIGIAATQINLIITTILATGTVVGAVSWLSYAFRLFQFPVGILSVSIASSNLVHFSEKWKEGSDVEAIDILKKSYLLSLVTIIPAFSLLFFLSDQATHLVYERGVFNSNDTSMTGLALRYYLLGLPCYGLYKIFTPVFFTLDKPKVPVFISIGCIVFNIIFCVLLTPKHGFSMLALGTSLSMLLNCFIQTVILKKELSLNFSFFINPKFLKIMASGAVCCIATYYSRSFYPFSDSALQNLLFFALSSFLGVIAYAVSLVILGEWSTLRNFLKK